MSETQVWSASFYDANARFVSDLGAGVMDWLAPQPGESILDLGCGDGALTAELVEGGAVVTGVDSSPSMIDAARARGVDARQMNGAALAFNQDFDAVFSNAALHWMIEADAVIEGVWRALKPGGRFVAEFGGHGNVAAVATALRAVARLMNGDAGLAAPWYFPTAESYAALLSEKGFNVERTALIPRPTPLPTGLAGWLETFRKPFFDQFGDRRREALELAESLLAPSLRDPDGRWTADYVRLRIAALRP